MFISFSKLSFSRKLLLLLIFIIIISFIWILIVLGYIKTDQFNNLVISKNKFKKINNIKALKHILEKDKKKNNNIIHIPTINNIGLSLNEEVNSNIYIDDPKYIVLNNTQGLPFKPTSDRPISLVIVNYQEPYVVKTINGFLTIPSQELINEILIIDDFSNPPLTYDMFQPDKRIRIIRAKERLGLILARYIGGNNAQGPFMILLDAHVKPHDNWLKPIVKLLRENYKRILNMEVGIMDGETWTQTNIGSIGAKAAFKWDLNHFWEANMDQKQIYQLSGIEHADVDESPITMGMFATTKKWWKTIGGMDSGLKIWGGENIEISLRTWLCGGEIKVARGSFVDHTFRTKFPYTVDGNAYRRNLIRIAEAWFDEPSKIKFYKASNIQRGAVDFGNIDEQLALKKSLNCHDFSWYLAKFKGRSPLNK